MASDTAAIQKVFFNSPFYAVVGASKDQTKFGTKVLNWYKARSIDVKPVHPKESELEGIPTIKSIDELASPNTTSISVITPARITLDILKKAKELDVPAVWIQPGATDEACIDFIKTNGLEDRVIYGGPCILVEGDGIRSNL